MAIEKGEPGAEQNGRPAEAGDCAAQQHAVNTAGVMSARGSGVDRHGLHTRAVPPPDTSCCCDSSRKGPEAIASASRAARDAAYARDLETGTRERLGSANSRIKVMQPASAPLMLATGVLEVPSEIRSTAFTAGKLVDADEVSRIAQAMTPQATARPRPTGGR